jgi:type I restriction enzyme, S subunit
MIPRQPLFDRPLPDGWQLVTVDDIKAPEKHSCVAGPFGSNISSKYFTESGVPVIRGNNLRDDLTRFVAKGFAFVSEEQAKNYKAQHVKPGDLVFTCWGTLGQVGLIPEGGPYPEYIISNKQLKLRPDSEACNPVYLFYYFGSPYMIEFIRRITSSAAVPGINLGLLKSFQIALPPLDLQDRIASILSAYDDLIENNARRIAILEEMARALYQEWFVHFRFPGHEHVPLVASPLGPIPGGWHLKAASDVLDVNPKIRSDREPLKPFVPMSGLSESSMLISDIQVKETRSGARFQNGHTLLARITPCLENGKTGYADFLRSDSDIAHGSTEFLVLRGRAVCSEFVYLLARSDIFRDHAIKSMSGATGRQRVRNECFNTFYLAEPDPTTMARFKTIVEPMFQAVLLLAKKNENLRTTRDLLLPKLISGEIEVSGLSEEQIAEAAD